MNIYDDNSYSIVDINFHNKDETESVFWDKIRITDNDLNEFFKENFHSIAVSSSHQQNISEKFRVDAGITEKQDEGTITDILVTRTISINDSYFSNNIELPILNNSNFIDKNFISDRKFEDDSMRKKAKVRIEESIRCLMNNHYKNMFPGKKIAFKKLSQKFINNPSIEMNKKALNMTIEERLSYDYGDDDNSKKKLKANKITLFNINFLLKENVNPNSLLRRKVKDLIRYYIDSPKYRRDLKKIEEIEGIKYAKKFDTLVKGNKETLGYVDYYLTTPANKKRNNKNK